MSITLVQTISHRNIKNVSATIYEPTSISDKNAFTSQILMARKINQDISLQIAPTFT